MAKTLDRDAMVVAAFAADAVTELTVALVQSGHVPQWVAHDLALRAERAAKAAGEDHGAQLMRIRARLADAHPRPAMGNF